VASITTAKRLGDIVNFKRGYDLPAHSRLEGKYPVISSSGISGYHSSYKVDGEGLVTGRYGTLGTMYYLNGKYWPHNTALYVTDFKGNYPKYVYFLMKCLGHMQTSNKSAVPGINRNDLHEIQVPYVSVAYQKNIANLLFNIEAKIDLNKRINAELEAMAKTLYDYWFVQFDFPDANGKPYKTSGGKMVWNEVLKRDVPKGWEIQSLLSIANFTNGLACQKFRPAIGEAAIKVIKIRDMKEGFSTEPEWVRADIPAKVVINNGDVLFSWSASLEVILWSGGIGALNQHIFKVTSGTYPKSFFYFQVLNYLQHFKMMAEIRKTTMGHITQEHLQQSKVAVPPVALTMQLDKLISPILNKQITSQVENQSLAALRDWLLPMLMNGQVRVA
jgi:type I restriction enzyme, S subunit